MHTTDLSELRPPLRIYPAERGPDGHLHARPIAATVDDLVAALRAGRATGAPFFAIQDKDGRTATIERATP